MNGVMFKVLLVGILVIELSPAETRSLLPRGRIKHLRSRPKFEPLLKPQKRWPDIQDLENQILRRGNVFIITRDSVVQVKDVLPDKKMQLPVRNQPVLQQSNPKVLPLTLFDDNGMLYLTRPKRRPNKSETDGVSRSKINKDYLLEANNIRKLNDLQTIFEFSDLVI